MRIETFSRPEPGPRQWVAILEVLEPDKNEKTRVVACMNFWGASEIDSHRQALAWWESEVERARKREEASQKLSERMRGARK